MNRTIQFGSAIALAGLVMGMAIVPANAGPAPVNYEPGKLTADKYASVGKKAIPFNRDGKIFMQKNYKSMGIYEFKVEYNQSDVHDDAQVNNDGWFKDMTAEMYKMVEAMFTEMGFTVKDKDAFSSDSSFAPIRELANGKYVISSDRYRGPGSNFKDGKPSGGSNTTYTFSFLKQTVPGLYFFDSRTLQLGMGWQNTKGNMDLMREVERIQSKFYTLGKEAAAKQDLDFIVSVFITAGLNSDKNGTPETGMEIHFTERPAPPDPSAKLKVTIGSNPYTMASGLWYIKKGDNRIGGSGSDKKQINGEKLKTSMLDMFKVQCNTYAATYNMFKEKSKK